MSFKRSIRLLLIVFTLFNALPAQAGWWDDISSWVSSAAQKVTVSVKTTFNTPEKRSWGIFGLAAVGLLAWLGFTWKKKDDKPAQPGPRPPQPPVQPQPEPQAANPAIRIRNETAVESPNIEREGIEFGNNSGVNSESFIFEKNVTPADFPAEPEDLLPKMPDTQSLNTMLPSLIPAEHQQPVHAQVVPITPMRGAPSNLNPAASPVLFSPVPATPDKRVRNFGGLRDVELMNLPAVSQAQQNTIVPTPTPMQIPRNDDKSFSPPASPRAAADLTLSVSSLASVASTSGVQSVAIPALSKKDYTPNFESYCADPFKAERDWRLHKIEELDEKSSSMVIVSTADIPKVSAEHLNKAAECHLNRILITPPNEEGSKRRFLLVVVHGTFSSPASFGLDKSKPLTQEIYNFGHCLAQATNCAVEIVSFKWSGELDVINRNQIAAQVLATDINSLYTEQKKKGVEYVQLWTIAHSHGCNVVNRAAQILATEMEKKISVDTCIHIASPAPDDEATLQYIKKLYHFYGSRDVTQVLGSLQTTRKLTRKYPISQDPKSARYNIRVALYREDLNHVNIKVPVVKSLPRLIYMVETNYMSFCDLDANITDGKLPCITIRDRNIRAEPYMQASIADRVIRATNSQMLAELARIVALYTIDDAAAINFSDAQAQFFFDVYGREMKLKPGILSRALMFWYEARSTDVPDSMSITDGREIRIHARGRSKDLAPFQRPKPRSQAQSAARAATSSSSSSAAAAAAAAQTQSTATPAKK